jgi:hypothetical protein
MAAMYRATAVELDTTKPSSSCLQKSASHRGDIQWARTMYGIWRTYGCLASAYEASLSLFMRPKVTKSNDDVLLLEHRHATCRTCRNWVTEKCEDHRAGSTGWV